MDELFKCKLCKNIITEPICLPCGETVCKSHTKEICDYKCKLCLNVHKLPTDGFPPNIMLNEILSRNIHKLNINIVKLEETKKTVGKISAKAKDFASRLEDPELFIYEHCQEMTRQVDIRREQLILSVVQYSENIIEEIEKWKSTCLKRSKTFCVENDKLKELNSRIKNLNNMFDDPSIDDKKLEEILHKEKTNKAASLLKTLESSHENYVFQESYFKPGNRLVSIKKLYGPFSSLKNMSIDVQCTNIFRHDDWIHCVKFDGRGLLGTGTQTCLKIWNVDTGLCIRNISSTETNIVNDVSIIHFEIEAENDTSCVVAFSSKSDTTDIKCWSINNSVNYDIDYTPQYLDYFVMCEKDNFIRIAFDKEYHKHLTKKNASSTFRVMENMQLPSKDKCPKCKDILGDGIEKPLSRLIICGHIYHVSCVRALCCVCYKDCSQNMPYTPSDTSVSFIQIKKYTPSNNGDYGTIMYVCDRNVYIKKNDVACGGLKESHNATVCCVNDSKDGLIASGSMDTDIKIWDSNGKYIKTLSGHTGGVLCVRFNEDGLLASGSYDKTVRLWDVETGQCIKTLIGHEQIVTSVDFDGNGMLASGSYDKTVRLWKISG